MLKVYNTLSQKKEIFKPRRGKKINLFVCGPTVYDFSHIGHARTYVVFDMIVKYLRQKGFDVFYLQNITDIDDKIINRAREINTSPKKLALEFEKEYLKDMKALKVNSVTKYARATSHIKEIISQVKRLLKKGYAYQIEDGIYYDISKFKKYGKLSRRTALQAEDAVSRIDESLEKRNKGDFCLWKFSPPAGGAEEPAWPSPWGKGRPGWHIEDTAITEKFFGSQYDIHGGAQDLIFPHHEAEIAQMEAASGKLPLVKYWLHVGFLRVSGQKMSKSLGNFITIKDFLKDYGDYPYLRFFILKNRYSKPISFNNEFLLSAKGDLEFIWESIENFKKLKYLNFKKSIRGGYFSKEFNKITKEFQGAMEDDFNTPKAIAALFDLITTGNFLMDRNKLSSNNAKEILDFLKKIDVFFNFIFYRKPSEKIPQEVLELVQDRERFRKQGKWQEADEIRKKIQELGYVVQDTKEGTKIKKI